MENQSNLEKIAIQKREELIAKNVYNVVSPDNGYSATHTRALSDTETPLHGKGTGIFMDTSAGGDDVDINGSLEAPGSGRIKNIATNQYNGINDYETPNQDGNIGQVTI